jgi:hypothetical protein
MMMRKDVIAVMGAALLAAAPMEAQVFTPTYQAPVQGQDIGVYLFDAGDVGIEGMLRQRIGSQTDLGLRLGFAEAGDDEVITLGADLRAPLRLGGTAPIALALTGGAQALLGDLDAFGIQGGVSIGYTFAEANLTPYIHPRLALVNAGDDSELELGADIGFDLGVSDNLILRLGANVGDIGADWGVGLAWRR